MALALGSGILFTYPQIATLCGVQGLVIYTLSSSLPLLLFGLLGPIIRRKCPEGFVLTEWTRQRYGAVTALLLSLATWVSGFWLREQITDRNIASSHCSCTWSPNCQPCSRL